jgi:hypothetical protein
VNFPYIVRLNIPRQKVALGILGGRAHHSLGGLVAAMAVNRIVCASSATLTGDYLAISQMNGALAMRRAALAMHSALAMDPMSMQRCPARPVRSAHKLAEVEAVVVRDFTPAFASFELPCDRFEALARCIGEQVCMFQVSVAEPRR